MNVGEDVYPGDDHGAVALVARDLQTQQVLCLHRQDSEGRSCGKAIEHGTRKVDRDEAEPEHRHQDLVRGSGGRRGGGGRKERNGGDREDESKRWETSC